MRMAMDEEEKHIAAIFGIKEGKDLPPVTEDTIEVYYHYLSKNLLFPFSGEYQEETGPLESSSHDIKVTRLLSPDEYDEGAFYGLFCEGREGRRKVGIPLAEIDVKQKGKIHQLIEAYKTWFWNYR